jgi:hypothetical protein
MAQVAISAEMPSPNKFLKGTTVATIVKFPANHHDDVVALRHAIQSFGDEHGQRPFGVLREIGVQAALKRLADMHLAHATTVDATLVDSNQPVIANANGVALTVDTDRVRLESKILMPDADAGRAEDEEGEDRGAGKNAAHDRTDLLLYRRNGVRLVRHKSGPGDIVYRSFAADVLAAVEIKADPSHTVAQKRGYGKDIERLLKLRSFGIHGFFVLLDKSSPFYGNFHPTRNCICWDPQPGHPTSLAELLKGSSRSRADYSAWQDILIARTAPGVPHIEVYNLSTADKANRHYYAYWRPGFEPNAKSRAQ